MLKWTSKSSMRDSADSVAYPVDVKERDLDDLGNSTIENRAESYNDLPSITGQPKRDFLSDDFKLVRNKHADMYQIINQQTLNNCTEEDLNWSPLSKSDLDQNHYKKRADSVSLPSSPAEHGDKSKHVSGSSKSIISRFKKMFGKSSSRDSRSRSLPGSPRRTSRNVERMFENRTGKNIESGKKTHTRLERLIESKRSRKKSWGHEKHVKSCEKKQSPPSKREWKENMKSRITLISSSADIKIRPASIKACDTPNDCMADKMKTFIRPSDIKDINRMPEKFRCLVAQNRHNSEKYLWRNTSLRNNLKDPSIAKRQDLCELNRIRVDDAPWNKRYSDTFIEVHRFKEPGTFSGIPRDWCHQHPEPGYSNSDKEFSNDKIVSGDNTFACGESPRRIKLPAIDPVAIQMMKKSLRPCIDTCSRQKNLVMQRRSTSNIQNPYPISENDEFNKMDLTSKHTKNNNNGHHHLIKRDIDDFIMRSPDLARSPIASSWNTREGTLHIPSTLPSDDTGQCKFRGDTSNLNRSSFKVKDMVRYLEERINHKDHDYMTSPSPNKIKFNKKQADQLSLDGTTKRPERQALYNNVQTKYPENDWEKNSLNALCDYPQQPLSSDHYLPVEKITMEGNIGCISSHYLLEDSPENGEKCNIDEDKNDKLSVEIKNEQSHLEEHITTANSLGKTSELGTNFIPSTTSWMSLSYSDVISKDQTDLHDDISSLSTLSKLALNAKEYCGSSSESFTSNFSIKLEQDEKSLSDKISISSCSDNLSATSVNGKEIHGINATKLTETQNHHEDELSISLTKELSDMHIEDNNKADYDYMPMKSIDTVDEKIKACVNITTHEYFDKCIIKDDLHIVSIEDTPITQSPKESDAPCFEGFVNEIEVANDADIEYRNAIQNFVQFDHDVHYDEHRVRTDLEDEMTPLLPENEGVILFTMPDFGEHENVELEQDNISMETHTILKKSVSFNLEKPSISLTSNDSSDKAEFEGTSSEQSYFIREKEQGVLDGISNVKERSVECSLNNDDFSLEKDTISLTSTGILDISWVLKPTSNDLLGVEMKALSSPRFMPYQLMDTCVSSSNVDHRVCDIEEPSLIMNTQSTISYEESSKRGSVSNSIELDYDIRDQRLDNSDEDFNTKLYDNKNGYDSKDVRLKRNKKIRLCLSEQPNIEDTRFNAEYTGDEHKDDYNKENYLSPLCSTSNKSSEISKRTIMSGKDQQRFQGDPNVESLCCVSEETVSVMMKDVGCRVSVDSSPVPSPDVHGLNPIEYKERGEDAGCEFQNSCPLESCHRFIGDSENLSTASNRGLNTEGYSCDGSHDTLNTWSLRQNNGMDYLNVPMLSINDEAIASDKVYMSNKGHSREDDESKATDDERVKEGLFLQKKDKISHSLRLSGASKRDADFIACGLSFDSSGDGTKLEEEIHSSVSDNVVKELTALKLSSNGDEISKKQKGRVDRKSTSEQRKHGRVNKHRKSVKMKNELESNHLNLKTSKSLELFARKSFSDFDTYTQTKRSPVSMNGSEFEKETQMKKNGKERNSKVPAYYFASARKKNDSNLVEKETKKKQEIHWTTDMLNYRPGQWLFVATFLFFQLLFHCLYV